MHRISDVRLQQLRRDTAVVTATLRSPELGHALRSSGQFLVFGLWVATTVILFWFAWEGAFGQTAHAFIRLCIVSAIVLWVLHNGNRIWQDYNDMTLYRLVATFDSKTVRIESPDGDTQLNRSNDDIRFSARPHQTGPREERDERWIGHPIGYTYRDAWEIWCEAGLDVEPIIAVSNEHDARAIVRYLTEANLIATRGADEPDFGPGRAEPA